MKRTSQGHVVTIALLCPFILAMGGTTLAQTPASPAAFPSPGLEARPALGDETTAILRGASHIQVFRLWDNNRATMMRQLAAFQGSASPVSEGDFGGYQTIDHDGPDQGRAFSAQVDRLLFDNELYDPGGLVKCFDPGVGLRFWNGRERVDVALCFECSQLSISTFNAAGKLIHDIPQLAMGLDQPLFVRLIQPLFPRDADIQAVKAYPIPAEVATPEARTAQEDDIREVIFRHLMTEQAPGEPTKTIYFLSIGPTNHIPADPDHALLQRFVGSTPIVEPISAKRPVSTPQESDIYAVFLRAAHLWWIEPTTVYAEATYATASGVRKSFTYGLTKTGARWVVTEAKPGWGF